LIEKSMASPSVLAILLTTKYVDDLPLHRFEKVLGRHGVDIPRQTLARWVIQIDSPPANPGCGCKPVDRRIIWLSCLTSQTVGAR
jgi:hypothetical protein